MELVQTNQQGRDVTTSLIVAEIFGKNHKNVLRDIETLSCSDDFRVLNFEHTPYIHPQNGQEYHYYEITKDGFAFLVMGYTGEKASLFKERFINEFNKREALLKSDDYILMRSQQILQLKIERAQQKVKQLEVENNTQKQLIAEMKKGNDYLNKILQSKGTVTTTQIAADYGLSAKALNFKLKEMKIQHKVNGQWILYSPFIGKGYLHSRTISITHKDGTPDTRMTSEWTQRGRIFLYDALKELGIIPLIEQH